MQNEKYFLAKATLTRLFARVTNPAICGGLGFIRRPLPTSTCKTEINDPIKMNANEKIITTYGATTT